MLPGRCAQGPDTRHLPGLRVRDARALALPAISYVYDVNGDVLSQTDPVGAQVTGTYDFMQRRLSGTQVERYPGVQSLTTVNTYDSSGNLQSVKSPAGVLTSYGYNAAGEQTAYTDGNGHATYATYNSLGLAESVIEPPAGANTSPGASTGTTVYDAAGNVVTQDLPGGVAVSNSYDVMGNLTGQTGSGASAATAARTFGYDAAGG